MIIADNHLSTGEIQRIHSQNPASSSADTSRSPATGIPGMPGTQGTPGAQHGVGTSQAAGAAAYAGQTASAGKSQAAETLSEGDRQLVELLKQDYQEGNATYSATIGKALTEAGLAPSAKNYQIASLLLDAGLSISRDSIRAMVAETGAFPDTPASVLVDMTRSGIDINPENIKIVQDFMDHSQTFADELSGIADMIESVLSDPNTSPELNSAIRSAVYNAVMDAAESSAQSMNEVNNALANIASADQAQAQAAQAGDGAARLAADSAALTQNAANPASGRSAASEAMQAGMSGSGTEQVSNPGSTAFIQGGAVTAGTAAGSAVPGTPVNMSAFADTPIARIVVETSPATLPQRPATEEGGGSFSNQPFNNAAGNSAGGQGTGIDEQALAAQGLRGRISDAESERLYDDISFSNLEAAQEAGEIFESALETDPDRTGLHRMLADEFKAMSPAELKKALKGALSLRPGEINKENVKDLYKRTYEFLDKIKNAADNSSGNPDLGSGARHAAKELETLYKLNNMYPHFELPIQLNDGEAQSGFYVYANKRASQIKADKTSALLHLNMPNLGPVDIHLELNGKRLGMRFYTEDDARMALRSNIGDLNDKLRSMDYSVDTSFNPRKDAAEDEAKLPVSSKEKKDAPSGDHRYNFDKRA